MWPNTGVPTSGGSSTHFQIYRADYVVGPEHVVTRSVSAEYLNVLSQITSTVMN